MYGLGFLLFVAICRAIIFESCQMDVRPLVLPVSPSSGVVLSGERLCRQPQRGMGRLLTSVMCRQPQWGQVDYDGVSALDASLNHLGNGVLIVIASSYTSGLQLDSSDGCKLLAETDFGLAVAQFINHGRGLLNAKVQVHDSEHGQNNRSGTFSTEGEQMSAVVWCVHLSARRGAASIGSPYNVVSNGEAARR
ncbi:hypothetical protein [Pseudomonas sp. OV226]|uniref:hypothetical protein n=1 Tax=Pseudomonas sp. OV226 TaxID=2135588 RepID=UPI0015A7AA1A|nr:hypothetical protein [Pseudomonas sp. OV226]